MDEATRENPADRRKKAALAELLAKANDHVPTPEDIAAQRKSWVTGEMLLRYPTMTYDDAAAIYDTAESRLNRAAQITLTEWELRRLTMHASANANAEGGPHDDRQKTIKTNWRTLADKLISASLHHQTKDVKMLEHNPKQTVYKIGDKTRAMVFEAAGLADAYDLQSVFDAVEAALVEPQLLEAAAQLVGDYQTSEQHHPNHVLVPRAAFEALRAAMEAKGQTDE